MANRNGEIMADHRIYIAGPDLFLMDWPQRAARVQALCANYGLTAILPVPATTLTGPGVTEPSDAAVAAAVFQSCLDAVRKADGVIANLAPFRGDEPDSGTVTECALAYAWGKPVIGYANSPVMPVSQGADGRMLTEDGGWVEQFGLTHNLMLHGVCQEIVTGLEDAVAIMATVLQKSMRKIPKKRDIGFSWNEIIQRE